MDIDVTWSPSNNPGGSVTVVVTYDYEYIIGSMFGLDPVDLEGRSTMIVNGSDPIPEGPANPKETNKVRYKFVFI